jgi:hypothetical protein
VASGSALGSRKEKREVRPTILFLAAITVMLVVAGGVAFAAVAQCDTYGNCHCQAGVLCQGTSQPQDLTGTTSADRIYGYGGNDGLYGLDGNDYLNGESGEDNLDGGGGTDDVCNGGPDSDWGNVDTCESMISIEMRY